ncbi:MAG: DUF721 domain-containing protein [Alistipes sp.]|nr:DUF721 domain-containing protein [Alistipes sp.]MBQ8775581.1 DUF721 domain-containing protein [Alistipes sp.]
MRRTKTTTIGEILKEFFARPYIAAKVAEGRLPEYWKVAVGDAAARATTDIKFENHILTVRISSGVIRQELFYRRDAIAERLNELAGIRLVNAIIVR